MVASSYIVKKPLGHEQVERFSQGKLHTVNGIYICNTVNEVKKLWGEARTGVFSVCTPYPRLANLTFCSRWGRLQRAHVGFVRGLGKARRLPPWMRCWI